MNLLNRSHTKVILILGALTALSPFSIDMYLPAFPKIALDFHTTVSDVALSLSAYFIGLATGQLFYGPLLDRFGRKKPLYVGLLIYIFATIACMMTHSTSSLVGWRFVQALGGCGAGVAAFAMVRDLFDPKDSAKVFALLILILGASPLFAPTIGGYLTVSFGWQSAFAALALMALSILFVVIFFLKESHHPDLTQTLKPFPILKNYWIILKDPRFYTYALSGAISFAGLFVYLAASPVIFMEIFKVNEKTYGFIFAMIAAGFVGTSQFNIVLLKKRSNQQVLLGALALQVLTSFVFVIGAVFNWFEMTSTIVVLFLFLAYTGLANPNSAALAMAPFGKNAGSASALLGFLQMSVGAVASVCVSVLRAQALLPIAVVFVGTGCMALAILYFGSRRLNSRH